MAKFTTKKIIEDGGRFSRQSSKIEVEKIVEVLVEVEVIKEIEIIKEVEKIVYRDMPTPPPVTKIVYKDKIVEISKTVEVIVEVPVPVTQVVHQVPKLLWLVLGLETLVLIYLTFKG